VCMGGGVRRVGNNEAGRGQYSCWLVAHVADVAADSRGEGREGGGSGAPGAGGGVLVMNWERPAGRRWPRSKGEPGQEPRASQGWIDG
jgi:hypothetical protein